MKRLLIFLPLLCLISCTEYVDIETVVQIQEKNVSSELIEQTRQQIIQRLEDIGFRDISVKQGELPIQFVISTMIEIGNDSRLGEYHSAFESTKFEIWSTYKMTDVEPEIRQVIKELAGVPGLRYVKETDRVPRAVFAFSEHADSLDIAKEELEKRFSDYKKMQFFWSDKPRLIGGEKLYELYVVNTFGRTAKITNEHITDTQVRFNKSLDTHTIDIVFNEEGRRVYARMTRQELKREIAMVINDRVCIAPTVQSEITYGRALIFDNFTAEEAIQLSNSLTHTPLPYTLKIIDEKMTTPE